MKNKLFYITILCITLAFGSCEPMFDNLEGDLTKMSAEDMLSSEAGLQRLLAQLYNMVPMNAFATGDKNTMDATDTHGTAYGAGGVASTWDYTGMRDINAFIEAIEDASANGTITEQTYYELLGEAHFVRGYVYFAMVRATGGVPIVTETLDDAYDGGENEGLYIPRSTEKETWDFVLDELDLAIQYLPEARTSGVYRATKWSALGLKSRAALYAASVSKFWDEAPIQNTYKAVNLKLAYMEASYADDYYNQSIEASEALIQSGIFGLYEPEPGSVNEAKENYQDLFLEKQDIEWIFGKSYQNGVSTNSNGFDEFNSPAQTTTAWQAGRYSVTLDMVDAYDDYDASFNHVAGDVKTRNDGVEDAYVSLPNMNFNSSVDYIAYDSPDEPFLNKDARFQASVLYPNAGFRNLTIRIQGGIIKTTGDFTFYADASETVGGITYDTWGGMGGAYSGFALMDDQNAGNYYSTGFGIRKFLDPVQVQEYSQNPWYDIRYAEVLLNYCEATVENGGGYGDIALAKTYLNQIRRRAYFLDEIEPTIENILHERRVEFAFENQLPYTLHRRRAYFNKSRDVDQTNAGIRHALVPVVDLQSGSPKYIFVRTNYYFDDTDKLASQYSVEYKEYYISVDNYINNEITPNPSQE